MLEKVLAPQVKDDMKGKFEVGSLVRFSDRCPQWVKREYKARTRTVSEVFYRPELQASIYYLADGGRILPIAVRSYALKPAYDGQNGLDKIGRPRLKRRYRRRAESTTG